MKEKLGFKIAKTAATLQEETFNVPSCCSNISIRHNLSSQYSFLVFMRLKDSEGNIHFQKQLANSEPVIQIGQSEKDTTIGGIPGYLKEGNWTIQMIVFSEHINRILKNQTIDFEVVISDKKEEIQDAIGGPIWVNEYFCYEYYDFKKCYCDEKRWYHGDLHTHTRLSDGEELPKDANRNCQAMGMDYYIPTEHNTIHTGWPETNTMIVPGVEITTTLGHANVFGIDKMPDELENILIQKEDTQIAYYISEIVKECQKRKWLFSVNHPFLHIWKWNYDHLLLQDMNCLEIINDPTYAFDLEANAEEANRKAVLLSDLLWADGYRICAVGGSDAHMPMGNCYPGADKPSIIGDPMTSVFLKKLTPKKLLNGIRKCRVYISRNCKVETNLKFGKILEEDCNQIDYVITLKHVQKCPIMFYIHNGEKTILTIQQLSSEAYQVQGIVKLDDRPYQWIRFGAETESGEFIFYGNPITKGKRKPCYHTFGSIRKRLETVWKSKEFYSIKMEH